MPTLDLPAIPGISARPFGGSEDFRTVADIVNAESVHAAAGWLTTPDEVALAFENDRNVDLETRFRLIEVNGAAVGYVIARWMQEEGGPRIYRHMCKLRPEWRGRGIGTAMLHWAQATLREIAVTHELEPKVFRTDVTDRAAASVTLLEADGYRAIQHYATLVRPSLDDIPEAALPDGLEIRSVGRDQLRAIFEADAAAFRDSWGFVEPDEGDWLQFLEFPHRDESLWKVAWDGDRIAGQVRSFINRLENEHFGRERGWTEFISTMPEWRGKGVATALICESLRELAHRGMKEAALGAHVESLHGAFHLYQSLGYEVESRGTIFEKPLAG